MTIKDEVLNEIEEIMNELEQLTLKAESGADWAEIAHLESECLELKADYQWLWR